MSLENAMVMRNGYGIRDSQETEGTKMVDALGTEIYEGDSYIELDGEVILEENLAAWLIAEYGAKKRYA